MRDVCAVTELRSILGQNQFGPLKNQIKCRMEWGVLQAPGRHCTRRPIIHCYLARTTKGRKGWKWCLNIEGPVRPMKSRPDYPEALRRVRGIKRKAGESEYEIGPTIRRDLQVRQRPGQQFWQSGKPAASSVDPKTGWIWWPYSWACSSSSTTWWSSTRWQEYWSQL